MSKKYFVKNLIIGAGLTGVSTAYFLEQENQRDYLIIEKESMPGGLLRCVKKDGYSADFTGHFLHFKDKAIKKLLLDNILEGNYIKTQKKSFVFLQNTFVRYPFQYNTFGLSSKIIKECYNGLLNSKKNENKDICNFHEWILDNMGHGIAKYFMIPYNEKLWTVHPKKMTTEWLGRFVPKPDLEKFILGSKGFVADDSYNSVFYYPKKGGIYSLIDGFINKIDQSKILLNQSINRIDINNKIVFLENKKEISYQNLINTIPLKELGSFIVTSREVSRMFNDLSFASVYNLNIGIKEKKTDKHWIYFPEKSLPFYRVGFLSNISPDLAPENCSLIYTEVSHSSGRPIDKDINKKIINSLLDLKIIKDKSKIEKLIPINIKYAYVIYDKKWRKSTHKIKKFLSTKNIFSIGRYGGWHYSSMEDDIIEAKNNIQKLL